MTLLTATGRACIVALGLLVVAQTALAKPRRDEVAKVNDQGGAAFEAKDYSHALAIYEGGLVFARTRAQREGLTFMIARCNEMLGILEPARETFALLVRNASTPGVRTAARQRLAEVDAALRARLRPSVPPLEAPSPQRSPGEPGATAPTPKIAPVAAPSTPPAAPERVRIEVTKTPSPAPAPAPGKSPSASVEAVPPPPQPRAVSTRSNSWLITGRVQMRLTDHWSGAGALRLEHAVGQNFSVGGGLLVTRSVGAFLRGTWWPLGLRGTWRPWLGIETPVLVDGGIAVGLGAVAGIEYQLASRLAVGIELPVYWFVRAPEGSDLGYAFVGPSLEARL